MPAIEIGNVSHSYSVGARPALRDLCLTIEPGESVALLGPSGAGKSTLLRVVNGLISPSSGSVRVLGADLCASSEADRMRLRRRIGMVFQEFALVERYSALTNVLIGRVGSLPPLRSVFGAFRAADVEMGRAALSEVGLGEFEERPVKSLSGGQRQRVAVARTLAQRAEIVLGDEPTANLDVRTSDEVLGLLIELAASRGVTLLLSLHDVRAARKHCKRIVALKDGAVAFDGAPDRFGEQETERVFYS